MKRFCMGVLAMLLTFALLTGAWAEGITVPDEAQEVMSGDVESLVPEEELALGDVNSDMSYSVEPDVNSPEDYVIMAPEGITDEDELDLVPYFVEADDSEGGQAVMASTADVDIGEYTYNLGDGGGTIIRYNGREGTVYVPSSVDYGGRTYKITKIAEAAFSDNTAISEVILPESILSIGLGAFRNCTQLSAVTINSDLANCNQYNVDAYYDYQRSPFYNTGTYSDSLTITFGDSVTRVPSYIFATGRSKDSNAYAHVTKVIMGDNITDIGAYAFYNCYDLTEVTWAAGLRNIWSYAFANDISLTFIDLPAKTFKLDEGAFAGCTYLETVVIPYSTQSIGWGAFRNCTHLSVVTINGDLGNCNEYNYDDYYDYRRSPFYNAGTYSDSLIITFGESVTRIPNYIFATGRSKDSNAYAHITKVVMGDNITDIGAYAFYRCYDLKEIKWSAGLRNISEGAFDYNYGLTTLNLPEKLFSIGEYAFASCSNLQTVSLPASLQSVGYCAFKFTDYLSNVVIRSDLADCDEDATSSYYDYQRSPFYGAGRYAEAFTIVFSKGVTRIPAYLFCTARSKDDGYYCRVKSVTIPETVKNIGVYAFYNCHDLSTVNYGGSPSQWKRIGVGDGNGYLLGANVACAKADTIKINKTKATIYNGKTLQLELKGATGKANWTSSNKKIATVSNTGLVTAKKTGTVVITAKYGNKKYTCKVTVKTVLSVNKTKLTVKKGKTVYVRVSMKFAEKGTVTWINPKTDIVRCTWGEWKGKTIPLYFTGRKKGSVIVTVTNSKTNDKVKIKVTVK